MGVPEFLTRAASYQRFLHAKLGEARGLGETATGRANEVQNAAGEVCVFEPSETSFTGYGVEISFCEVDVELFSLATGQVDFSGRT